MQLLRNQLTSLSITFLVIVLVFQFYMQVFATTTVVLQNTNSTENEICSTEEGIYAPTYMCRIAKRFLLGKAQRAGYQMEALRVLHNQEVAQYFIDTKDIQHKAYSISYTIQNDQETRQGICIFLLKYIAYYQEGYPITEETLMAEDGVNPMILDTAEVDACTDFDIFTEQPLVPTISGGQFGHISDGVVDSFKLFR